MNEVNIPKVYNDLHPTLPISQRLQDVFKLVMRRQIRAVVLQSLDDEVAFGFSEKTGCRGVLFVVVRERIVR